ncbi:hypothetical protein [Sphingobium sp. Cam5-1]|nr:hypothetical protein [Sphingobium sp. Cam5-1]
MSFKSDADIRMSGRTGIENAAEREESGSSVDAEALTARLLVMRERME